MKENNKWNKLASKVTINKTIESLKFNGIGAELVANVKEAKKKVLELIPQGSEIMNMSSVTLDSADIVKEFQSKNYISIKEKLMKMNRETQSEEMQKLGAAPKYAIGSVQAVTEDGKIIIASNTGSQLPSYAYGSSKVIWIVGTQKIVKNLDDAMKRIYEHCLPLESERAKKAYGVAGSNVSKILIINKEVKPDRIHLIFVNEVLGY